MAIIFEDNFEAYTASTAAQLRAGGWDIDDDENGRFLIPNVGGCRGTPNAIKGYVEEDQDAAFYAGHIFTPLGAQQALYLRMYVKYDTGYIFMETNEQKVAYLMAYTEGGTLAWRVELANQCYDASRTSCQFHLDLNRHDDLYYYNVGSNPVAVPGVWYCLEMMVRPYPSMDSGQIALWVDGELCISRTGIPLYGANDTNPVTQMNRLQIDGNYGGVPDAHPGQWQWWDAVALGTTYIGPTDETIPSGSMQFSVR